MRGCGLGKSSACTRGLEEEQRAHTRGGRGGAGAGAGAGAGGEGPRSRAAQDSEGLACSPALLRGSACAGPPAPPRRRGLRRSFATPTAGIRRSAASGPPGSLSAGS
eukprot:4276145-Pyramimonas_sp.AAC.1